MVPINNLTDRSLLHLFRQLTLQDLLSARLVNRRWSRLVPAVTQTLNKLILLIGPHQRNRFEYLLNFNSINARKSVQLLEHEDGTPLLPPNPRLTGWNSLQFDALSADLVGQILTTFPAITELSIALISTPESQAEFLVQILASWRNQLTSLKFNESFNEVLSDLTIDRIYSALNSLVNLRKLSVNFSILPARDLPIIRRLEELDFCSVETSPQEFSRILRHHAPESRLQRIGYQSPCAGDDHLRQFTSLPEALRDRFTRLRFFNPLADPAPICFHFRHLTSLHLAPSGTTFPYLFAHLSQLSALLLLRLDITFESMSSADDQSPSQLPQVKSVRALELNWKDMNSHLNLAALHLGQTMPALEVLQLYLYSACKCADCDIDPLYRQMRSTSEQARQCLKAMLGPLKSDCTKLKAILYESENILSIVEALLAE